MDVPCRAARRRIRRRYLGKRFQPIQRQQRRLDHADGRSRTRHRLSAYRGTDTRLVRRPSARRQPVLVERCGARCTDRRAHLALSARTSRYLGFGQSGRADSRRHRGRRAGHSCRCADHEAGLGLRLRPRDRRAGLADRGTAGACVIRARRARGRDTAVSDPAARVCAAGSVARRIDRLHAGAARAGARGPGRVQLRSAVRAARRQRFRPRDRRVRDVAPVSRRR